MAIQDFLITFRADTGQALTAINALYQRVQQVDTALNRSMGRQSNIAAPLNQVAAAAAPAARGITATTSALGQLSNVLRRTNLSAEGKKVQDLATKFITLRNAMRMDQAQGRFVNESQLKNADRLLDQLGQSATLTRVQVDALRQSMERQFGSAARVPEAFRGQPERIARAATAAGTAESRALGGSFRTNADELRALAAADNRLRALSATGQDVSARLAVVASRINQVSAAAANSKSMDQLNRRFRELDKQVGRGGGLTRGRITEMRDVLQQISSLGGAAAGGDSRAARMLPIMERQFARLPQFINPAAQAMLNFTQRTEQAVERARRFNLPLPAPQTMGRAFMESLDLSSQGFTEGTRRAAIFQAELNKLPPTFDEVARRFGSHARRIAEGILLYDAFGRAVQAVSNQIQLIGTLAREQIRFEVVVGDLGSEGNANFLAGISEVAKRTNTPLDQLASIMDTVAFATDRAASAQQREADALVLMGRAGEFTNVTQRDLRTETENMLGIMNVFQLSLSQTGDALAKIAALGGGSSEAIANISDVISQAGRSAATAGFDFDLLGAIGAEMFRALRGSMSGTEIGNQLKTVLDKMADPDIQSNIEDISRGIINFSDATGALRPADAVFTDIFAAIDAGLLTVEQGRQVLDELIPPLNPAAKSFVSVLQRVLPQALADVHDVAGVVGDDLSAMSDKMVSGPAEQFSIAIIGIQTALTALFSSQVTGTMFALAGILEGLGSILSNQVAGGFIQVGVTLVTTLAMFRALQIILRTMGAFLLGGRDRARELAAAMADSGIAARTGAPLVDRYGNAITTAGGNAVTATSRLRAFRAGVGSLARMLAVPLVLTIAIDVLGSLPDIVGSVQTQLNDALKNSRIDPDVLAGAFQVSSAPGLFKGLASAFTGFGNTLFDEVKLTPDQLKNVEALADASIRLNSENKLTADSFKLLEDAVLKANSSEEITKLTMEDLLQVYNDSLTVTPKLADADAVWAEEKRRLTEETEKQREAEEKLLSVNELSLGLADARAAEMNRLNQALRDGAITVDEFSEGQNNISSASEAAVEWIAAYADQLSIIPGLQERVAATGETAAEALMGILLDNPDTISERIDALDFMVERAEMMEEIAEEAANNPIEYTIKTEKLIRSQMEMDTIFEWVTNGTYRLRQVISDNPIEPEIALEKLKAQAQAALRVYQIMLQASSQFHRATSSAMQAANPEVGQALRARVRNQGGDMNALARAIEELELAAKSLSGAGSDLTAAGKGFDILGGVSGDDPRLGGSDSDREPQQTGIIDIGDLSPASIGQIIAIATAAQARVVAAGGVVDADETVALFKDATFQRLIAGIDQRFLQQAIEELTDVERKRLELEQARLQDVTRSIVSQVGPIQSLMSAPVLAAGGGLLTGQGFNADPRLGNITINVPINWSGMNLSQLQEYIYSSISQAWIDAGRGA